MGKKTRPENPQMKYLVGGDPYSSRVQVYTTEKRTIIGRYARIFVNVNGGYGVTDFEQNSRKLKRVYITSGIRYTTLITSFRKKLPKVKIWEEEFLDRARGTGTDVIKVRRRREINPAIEVHADLFTDQFSDLAEGVIRQFSQLILDHPYLGFGDIPVCLRERKGY